VRSTAPIIAYQFNPLDNVNVFSNDASLAPASARSIATTTSSPGPRRWRGPTTPTPTAASTSARSSPIVGGEEQTSALGDGVDRVIPGGGIPAALAGDTLTFNIGPYDVINLETGGFNADFTGSQVHADKPVAVFHGSEASDVPFFTTFAIRDCCAATSRSSSSHLGDGHAVRRGEDAAPHQVRSRGRLRRRAQRPTSPSTGASSR